MGHPWFEDCIAVVRKQPNVFCEVLAIFYLLWQFYKNLISCQEYLITYKIFFGADYPFSAVSESIESLKKSETIDPSIIEIGLIGQGYTANPNLHSRHSHSLYLNITYQDFLIEISHNLLQTQ